jgi:hypothetical protein
MCCIICLEWGKGKMTSREAMGAISETIGNADTEKTKHLIELSGKIMDKDVSPGTDQNAELDEEWERKNRGSNR